MENLLGTNTWWCVSGIAPSYDLGESFWEVCRIPVLVVAFGCTCLTMVDNLQPLLPAFIQ